MPLSLEQTELLRRTLAEFLQIDEARVVPEANYFTDLGGDAEQLRPMRLAVEAALGVNLEPVVELVNSHTATDEAGVLTFPSLMAIKGCLPDWKSSFKPAAFRELFSVGMIEAMVARAVRDREEALADAEPPPSLAPQQAELLSRTITMVAVDKSTRVFDLPDLALGQLAVAIRRDFSLDAIELIQKLRGRFLVSPDGRLTAETLKHLRRLLPGIELDEGTQFDDLMTLRTLEVAIARQLADRPADLPLKDIFHPEMRAWALSLPADMGDRRYRLLLAACARRVSTALTDIRAEYVEAMETLERFADGADNKTALREMQRAIGSWKGWEAPYSALHDSVSAKIPDSALFAWSKALQPVCDDSPLYALRAIQRVHADLTRPQPAAEWQPAWRSAEAVKLAETMYVTRDFGAMSDLADALERAGCQDPVILEHCRDKNLSHVRGCWVVDEVLDGRWKKLHKTSKPKAESNPILARLSKRDRYELERLAQDPDGMLSVHAFYAKRWDSAELADERERIRKGWSRNLPYLTEEQVRIAVQFGHIGHLDPIIRRILWQDPRELAVCGSLSFRFAWLVNTLSPQMGFLPDLLHVLAVRDDVLARRLAATRDETVEPHYQCYHRCLSALLQRDFDAARAALTAKEARSLWKQLAWLSTMLQGVFDQQPAQVAAGLQSLVDKERRAREKENFGVVSLAAHGAYRLCEAVSPDLVADFDVKQEPPWDAEFHAWTSVLPQDPLAGLDLSDISPILHDAVIRLEPPAWWTTGLGGPPGEPCEVVILQVGPKPQTVIHLVSLMNQISADEAAKRLEQCPVVVRTAPRLVALHTRQALTSEGATVELRATGTAVGTA